VFDKGIKNSCNLKGSAPTYFVILSILIGVSTLSMAYLKDPAVYPSETEAIVLNEKFGGS